MNNKIIKFSLILAYLLNLIIITSVIFKFINDISVEIMWFKIILFLLINLFGMILSVIKLKEKKFRRNAIILTCFFIIQSIIAFIIPTYCDYNYDYKSIVGPEVMPSYYNIYGIKSIL